MNLLQPFKLHIYSYRKVYLLAFLIAVLSTAVVVFLLNNQGIFYLYTIFFLSFGFLFTFFLGYYEYNHLCDHYLNLKTSRLGFFLSSFAFGFFNAFIQTAIFLGLGFAISQTKETLNGIPMVYTNPFLYLAFSTYITVFIIHLAVFFFANLCSLTLRRFRNGRRMLYVLCLLFLGIFFNRIALFLREQTSLFFLMPDLLTKILPMLGIVVIILALLVAWQSRTIDLKK